MPATDTQKIGYEGYFYTNPDPDADETSAGWEYQAYVIGFSTDEPDSDIPLWNKTEYELSKPGRVEKTGTIEQIYTKIGGSLDELYKAKKNFAAKLEIKDSSQNNVISEVKYYTRFFLTSKSFNAGNLNDGEDKMSTSYNFRFNEERTVEIDGDTGDTGDTGV